MMDQGSVLGPRLFAYYAEDVQEIFEREEVMYHLFTDDMQGCDKLSASEYSDDSCKSARLRHCCFQMVCVKASSAER